jgi:hypothetical protein
VAEGGRDCDKGRKYQSGSGKCKAKEERAAMEKKVLSKMQKISEMFSPKTTVRFSRQLTLSAVLI